MSDEATDAHTPAGGGPPPDLTLGSWALILASFPFITGGVIVILTDVPPSGSPTLGMLSHALWALGIVTLTLGVVALLRWVEAFRTGLAGYLATGVLGLGVLHGLQWTTWAYVDVRAARAAEYELVLETIIVPFGARHLLMYCTLTGTGIALLGWALRRTELTHQYVGWTGVVLGILTAGIAIISLVAAFGGGEDGHILVDIATLLLPVLYLWATVLGIGIYRRGHGHYLLDSR